MRVNGRRFGGISVFLSPPPNIEKLFQSKDIDLREARLLAASAGLDELLGGVLLALEGMIESKVVSFSV